MSLPARKRVCHSSVAQFVWRGQRRTLLVSARLYRDYPATMRCVVHCKHTRLYENIRRMRGGFERIFVRGLKYVTDRGYCTYLFLLFEPVFT